MADDKELELDKPGKKKKIIIIAAVVAVIALAAGAGFFFLGGSSVSDAELEAALDTADPAVVAAQEEEAAAAEAGTALYVPMPRPFRFNVPGAARDRFVEIRVQLLVRGADNEETAKKHVPLLESTLLGVFSQANADDLSTSAGKTSLKQKSLAEVQKIMMDIAGNKIIEQVLFTGFVMQ
ncbi:flagellar basal body-associated protein FliL [Thalassomonas viridans]|uniref:Flagellar protein FliL n=1 Tax=Thalassomonas viridans TaxID=137584 RepID=A0AAF0C832_9GAMM|nr:flagellar basal body-associated protein FliL [Thalassomonas viridans]WDE03976.1 flagellar basal body-associated protein FliL [Thalassomonas viridans]